MSYLLLNSGGGSRLKLASGDLLLLATQSHQLQVTAPSPARGFSGSASASFTFSISDPAAGDTIVTPTSTLAGTWTPATLTLNAGTLSATATFTPAAYGSATIGATGNNSAVSASTVTYKSDSHDYYISASGSDANDGASALTPWQTIAKLLSWGVVRGATYRFEGGSSFEGSILIDDGVSGAAGSDLITIASYGTGLASITRTGSASAHPIEIRNAGGLKVDGVKIVGAGTTPAATSQHGVYVNIDLTSPTTIYNITVQGCEIYNLKRGIWMRGEGTANVRASSVQVIGNTIHHCWHRGINVGQNSTAVADANGVLGLVVAYNVIRDCDDSTQVDIAGVVWSYTTDALVIGNLIYNMGGLGTGNGVFNWGLNVRSVIRGNEVYNLYLGSVSSGDAVALNLDSGAQDCVVEYNYVHDIEGMGLACYTYLAGTKPATVGAWTNNTFRYNVVQNCGSEKFGAFVVLGDDKDGCNVYNNTFVQSSTVAGTAIILFDSVGYAATLTKNFRFYNNIFYAASNLVKFIDIAVGAGLQADSYFKNNLYFPVTGINQIRWFGTNYSTVAAWVAAATNKDTGAVTSSPSLSDAFTATVFNNPALISTLTKVTPTSGASPVVDAGLDLRAAPYNITGITRDYAGNLPRSGAAYDIGAIEFGSSLGNAPSLFTRRNQSGIHQFGTRR